MLNLPCFANPVLSEEEARKILAPYFEKFLACINAAWQQWSSYDLRHRLDARARAAFINSSIVWLAKEAFVDDAPFVKFGQQRGLFVIYVGDHIKLRFKKFKTDGTYSNLMTGQQLKLIEQKNIEGFLPGTFLTVGYQLDSLQQNIQARKITLQNKNRVIYFIDLDEAAAASSAPQVRVMPQAPVPVIQRRARAKKQTVRRKAISKDRG